MSQYDLVIRSGSVIDGTGRPAMTADVAVKDGIIVGWASSPLVPKK